jgi:pumilio RNA-binding family
MERASSQALALLMGNGGLPPLVHVQVPDGSEEMIECPLNLLCALVIVKQISSLMDLDAMLNALITADEIDKAFSLLRFASGLSKPVALCQSPKHRIDTPRILRDSKYAVQVQELVGGGSVSCAEFLPWLQGNVLSLALNPMGCRVVQKFIEVCSQDECMALVHPELSGRVIECALDVNGNHVIQKIIDKLASRDCAFIVDSLVGPDLAVRRMAPHCYGCRVIQRLISRCDTAVVEPVLEALCADPDLVSCLSEDVFGNYVMQHAIEFGRDIDRERISLCLASLDVVNLGCSKFASNVIEKIIRWHNKNLGGNVVVTKLLINAMLTSVDPCSGELGILTLMKDRYGNYVVRAIVELTRNEFGTEVSLVKNLIVHNSHELKKYTFSWHLVERMDKMADHGM